MTPRGIALRDEAPGDAGAIRDVITEAFRGAPHSSGTEARIVEELRAAGALALSLVAEKDEGIVGHLAVSHLRIGEAAGWFGIGPVSVRPERQSQGIGSALMKAALARLRAQEARGAVLVGDPGYYKRFGFAADPRIVLPGIPAEYLLALPFAGPAHGRVRYHRAFGIED